MHHAELTDFMTLASRSARRWARGLCPRYVEDAGQQAALGVLSTVRRGGAMNSAIAATIGFRAARQTSRMQLPAHTAMGAAVPDGLLAARTIDYEVAEVVVDSHALRGTDLECAAWHREVRQRLAVTTPANRAELLEHALSGDPIKMSGTTRSQLCRLRQLLRDDPVLQQLWEDLHDD
jgi:hypothetical protein